ncbi:hypothetical protein [Falsiroseomonas sp. E2-1-a20]|uniref:hypothetical protein n=1 Tax=Falsiroseomonas sp. E2-1-a20 TaxID=3239300 RepID=UPI003F3A0522
MGDLTPRPGRILIALLPAIFFLAVVLAPPLNQDVAAVLSFAERMVAGEALYAHLIDVNPPLIFLLNLPAAWLGAWTPLSAVRALHLLLLAFCAGILLLCLRLRRPGTGPVEDAMLLALLPLALLLAGYDFGQREHLMAAAALPYLFLAERRAEGVRTGPGLVALVTLVAATGFALKPHFLAVPALVEVLLLGVALRQGRLRQALRDPVPWGLGLLWLAYLALIGFGFPAYSGIILPLVRSDYLGFAGPSLGQALTTVHLFTATVATLALLAFAVAARSGTLGWLPRLLAAAALGGLAAALVQLKGWSYHVVPVWMFAGLFGGIVAARAADRVLGSRAAFRLAPLLAAGFCLALALFVIRAGEAPWRQFGYGDAPVGRLAAWLRERAPGDAVMALSPDIHPAYPAMNYAGNRPVLRFMSTWLLQAVYATCPADGSRFRAVAQMGAAERFLFDAVAQDLAEGRPRVVLVARDAHIAWCGGQAFEMTAYFARHPVFAEAWQAYRQVGEIDGTLLFLRPD